jgi:maltose O-acetyltransferase
MTSEYERMVSGQLYRPSDPDLKALRMRHRQLAREFNQTQENQREQRAAYLPQIFGKIGRNGHVTPPLYVDYGYNITIGENFYANYDAILLDVAPITIGNNVMFGPRVSLLTPGHPIDADVRNSGLEFGQPITIEDDVWLGGHVVVNPGVTIGARTIVGSGAVVTKDLPADVIAVGNPARVLRAVTDADRKEWQQAADAYEKSAE